MQRGVDVPTQPHMLPCTGRGLRDGASTRESVRFRPRTRHQMAALGFLLPRPARSRRAGQRPSSPTCRVPSDRAYGPGAPGRRRARHPPPRLGRRTPRPPCRLAVRSTRAPIQQPAGDRRPPPSGSLLEGEALGRNPLDYSAQAGPWPVGWPVKQRATTARGLVPPKRETPVGWGMEPTRWQPTAPARLLRKPLSSRPTVQRRGRGETGALDATSQPFSAPRLRPRTM